MNFEDLFEGAAPVVTVGPHELSAYVPCFNEALRLPYFLEHHRQLGVTKFFVVDNGSTDGSLEILRADPNVILLQSALPFMAYRDIRQHVVCNRYLADRWVLALDVDELLVYPGWPEVSGPELIMRLDRDGYQGLFTTMVDMYSADPIGQVTYRAGQSFIECCPYLDATGYRMLPSSGKKTRSGVQPLNNIYGGPRERLFGETQTFKRWLACRCFSLRQDWSHENLKTKLFRLLKRLLRTNDDGFSPRMSKLPLVKWQLGYEYKGCAHVIKQPLRLSPMWGALLHFKYFQDFAAKVEEAVISERHWNGSAEYKRYQARLAQVMQTSPLCKQSRRFEGAQSLLAVGLMRDGEQS